MYAITSRTKADESLFDEDESKCPPQTNPNQASHNSEEQVSRDCPHEPRMKHDKDKKEANVHKHQHMLTHKHKTQCSMESSQRHKERRNIVQIDKAVAMEEGVLHKEKINGGYPPGHVPLSNPNERWASNEDRNTVQDLDVKCPGTSGGQRVVSPSRRPDVSPGAAALGNQAHHCTERRPTWIHEHVSPGAFREGSLENEETYEEEECTIHSHAEPPIPPTVSAELVNTKEEERRHQDDINQAVQRARQLVQDQIQQAVVAEVIPEVISKRDRRWKFACIFVLLALVVVGVVLGITLRPDSDPETFIPQDLIDFLSSASSDSGEALRTPSMPQNKALEWLANNTKLANYTDQEKVQRYALATLYYSTKGDTWARSDFWLSNADVCGKWYQYNDTTIDCTDTGAVLALDIEYNNLQGTIPPEIGMLSDRLGYLDFSENNLSGTIPSEIGMLSDSLEDLWLNSNALNGTIPAEVGQLKRLISLAFSDNALTGTIPSKEINNLTNLNELYLYGNMLTGDYTCPDFITDCWISCDDWDNNYTDACRSL